MARRRKTRKVRAGSHHVSASIIASQHGHCTRALDELVKAARVGQAGEAKVEFFRRCVMPQRSV